MSGAFGLGAALALAAASSQLDPYGVHTIRRDYWGDAFYDPFGSANQRRPDRPRAKKTNPNREKQKAAKQARKRTKRGRP